MKTIPGLKNKIVSAKLLATGAELKTSATANGAGINLPTAAPDKIASVIKVEVKGKVTDRVSSKPKKEMESGSID
jgi:alpha-L-fucosidase